jgi:hypothetical protein
MCPLQELELRANVPSVGEEKSIRGCDVLYIPTGSRVWRHVTVAGASG